ncbi:MAG: hypothetical protein E7195_01425 [Peptococcaceae bacterium]|nr:hypothetical protein [Peptococcaceae bacterium]MBQ3510079.1 hypothetical protein [Peptococcaceae bacterium]
MLPKEPGFVNENNQKNLRQTDEPGTEYEQWFYEIQCMNCGLVYKVNEQDIFHAKCPACQEQ